MFSILKQKVLASTVLVYFIFAAFFSNFAVAQTTDTLNIRGEAAILVDGASGKILYEKNIDEPLPIASMTKMMTEYLVLEAIKKGQLQWDQKTSVSDYAFRISQNRSLSNVPLRKDVQYSVKELFEAAAIYSANGAAIVLAEIIAGSETEFVKQMNNKAKELGLKDYKFVNSTGLNNQDLLGQHPQGYGADEENILSARATALLAYRLTNDYPEVLETSSIPKKDFQAGPDEIIKMDNWNWMLPSLVFAYEGMDGLKTGSTDIAGYSFTGTTKRNDLRLISVVMRTDSYNSRFAETRKLLDYGFNSFTRTEIFPKGFQIPSKLELPVIRGKEKSVEVESKNPLVITIRRGEEKLYNPEYILDEKVSEDGNLIAPLEKGQRVGALGFKYTGDLKYQYLASDGIKKEQAALIAKEEINEAGFIRLFFRNIIDFISDTFNNLF